MSRILLTATPGKIIKDEQRAEFDREGTVLCFLSHKIQPVCIEADRSKIYFVFDEAEIRPIKDRMLSNADMQVDFRDVILARELWQNALGIFRDKRTTITD